MGTVIMGIGSGTGLTMRPTGEALPDGHACCVPVYGHAALWREPAAGTEREDPVLLSGQRCDPGLPDRAGAGCRGMSKAPVTEERRPAMEKCARELSLVFFVKIPSHPRSGFSMVG